MYTLKYLFQSEGKRKRRMNGIFVSDFVYMRRQWIF